MSKEKPLKFLMTPWVDKAIAVVAVIPFAWLTYIRLQSFGFDVPRVALLIQGLVFIGSMIVRKTPVRVSTNPWWLSAYSPLNITILALGIFWFVLKSLAEETFLRSDAAYAAYMQRVRWRWLPGIAWTRRVRNGFSLEALRPR